MKKYKGFTRNHVFNKDLSLIYESVFQKSFGQGWNHVSLNKTEAKYKDCFQNFFKKVFPVHKRF